MNKQTNIRLGLSTKHLQAGTQVKQITPSTFEIVSNRKETIGALARVFVDRRNTVEYSITDNEAEIHAKLFNVAPELLNFAIEMKQRYPNSPWIYEEAERLIKKITK